MNNKIKKGLPIRVVLCGLGNWGQNWFENIKNNKDFDLVGVVDTDINTLKKFKEYRNINESVCFNNVELAIKLTNPDAVIVVVSPTKHGEIIKIAIRNGINILSEKPLAKDIGEAKEFLHLHEKYKKVEFVINQNYRGRNCIATIKDLLKSNTIGDVGYFIYNHQQKVKIPGYRLEIESPIIDDMSIHHFDLIRYLTGQEFKEIYASENTTKWSWFKGKPVLYTFIKMSNCVSGIYCGSWVSEGKNGSWNGNIQIFGSKGCIELNDNEEVLLYRKREVGKDLLGEYHPGQVIKQKNIKNTELQYTLNNFKDCLLKKIKCDTDIEDNIKSFTAVLAAKESIKLNKPISIKSLDLF